MKRLFFFFLAVFSIHTFAGEWSVERVPADVLKGWDNDFLIYSYSDSVGSFIMRTDKPDQFSIQSHDVFNTSVTAGRTGQSVRVGLYDAEGNLIEHFRMWLCKWDNRGTVLGTYDLGYMNNPVGQDSNVKKIKKHLMASNGYVRIVGVMYNGDWFEIRIYPNPNLLAVGLF